MVADRIVGSVRGAMTWARDFVAQGMPGFATPGGSQSGWLYVWPEGLLMPPFLDKESEMPPWSSFNHISLCVSDLKVAKEFYSSILGLVEAARPDLGVEGAWYQVQNGVQCHLIVDPMLAPPAERVMRFQPKDPHFALWTNNIEDTIAWLRERQVAYDELPDSPTMFRQIFIKDPDGNMIEFIGPTGKAK